MLHSLCFHTQEGGIMGKQNRRPSRGTYAHRQTQYLAPEEGARNTRTLRAGHKPKKKQPARKIVLDRGKFIRAKN